MARPDGTPYLVDDFPAIRIADLRRAAGGRKKFGRADYCSVCLPDGRVVRVDLEELKTNLPGHFLMKSPLCPTCGQVVRVIRVVPFGTGLACMRCIQKRLSGRFRSQLRGRESVR